MQNETIFKKSKRPSEQEETHFPDHDVRIVEARALEGNQVFVKFSDGCEGNASFQVVIDKRGVFTPMADPAFFQKVTVSDDGTYLGWPGDIDFDALALWMTIDR